MLSSYTAGALGIRAFKIIAGPYAKGTGRETREEIHEFKSDIESFQQTPKIEECNLW